MKKSSHAISYVHKFVKKGQFRAQSIRFHVAWLNGTRVGIEADVSFPLMIYVGLNKVFVVYKILQTV